MIPPTHPLCNEFVQEPTSGTVFAHLDSELVAAAHWDASGLDAVKLPNFGDRVRDHPVHLTFHFNIYITYDYTID